MTNLIRHLLTDANALWLYAAGLQLSANVALGHDDKATNTVLQLTASGMWLAASVAHMTQKTLDTFDKIVHLSLVGASVVFVASAVLGATGSSKASDSTAMVGAAMYALCALVVLVRTFTRQSFLETKKVPVTSVRVGALFLAVGAAVTAFNAGIASMVPPPPKPMMRLTMAGALLVVGAIVWNLPSVHSFFKQMAASRTGYEKLPVSPSPRPRPLPPNGVLKSRPGSGVLTTNKL